MGCWETALSPLGTGRRHYVHWWTISCPRTGVVSTCILRERGNPAGGHSKVSSIPAVPRNLAKLRANNDVAECPLFWRYNLVELSILNCLISWSRCYFMDVYMYWYIRPPLVESTPKRDWMDRSPKVYIWITWGLPKLLGYSWSIIPKIRTK